VNACTPRRDTPGRRPLVVRARPAARGAPQLAVPQRIRTSRRGGRRGDDRL